MLSIIPENIDSAIVCNVVGTCDQHQECEDCRELVIGIHNWLIASEQDYIVLDFQDEKEICPYLIEELVQLRKRMKIPFFFAGVMERPKQMICSYDYRAEKAIFRIPEEAVERLKELLPEQELTPDLPIIYGEPISLIRSRYSSKMGFEDALEMQDHEAHL